MLEPIKAMFTYILKLDTDVGTHHAQLSIYKLKVKIVPTNKPMIRKDGSDVVFRETKGKWQAVVVEISRMHKIGHPVLKLAQLVLSRVTHCLSSCKKLAFPMRVVKLTEGGYFSVKKLPPKKSWKVNEKLFPCKLTNEKTKLAEEAVNLVVETWGQRSLTELEASRGEYFLFLRKGASSSC